MEAKFRFESDQFSHDGLCNRIRVTISIVSMSSDIDKATYHILEIYDLDDMLYREFRHFNLREQRIIEAISLGLTSQYAGDALVVYQEYLQERKFDESKSEEDA